MINQRDPTLIVLGSLSLLEIPPFASTNINNRHRTRGDKLATLHLAIVSRPSPDEARRRYCSASGALLVRALARDYITLHNLLATGETRSSRSVGTTPGGVLRRGGG